MSQRTWLITGVSSGFGRELTDQLLARGERVVGTVRDVGKVADLVKRYPEAFHAETLDVTDVAAIRDGRRTLVRSTRAHRRDRQQRRLWPVRRGGGTFRRADRSHDRHQPGRLDPAHPRRAAASSRPGRRTHHPDLDLRRAGRLRRELDVPRHQVGHRRLRRVGRPGGRAVRDRHDDRRARRRAHRVPLRQRPGGEADARPTTTIRRTPSCACSIPRTVSRRAILPGWRRASSRASTSSPRRCAWCSVRRRWRARSRRCASGSPDSKRRRNSPLRRTSRQASDGRASRAISGIHDAHS